MPIPEHIRVTQLDLELNGGCNYKCEMCPQTEGREKSFLKKLPSSVLSKILDDALQYGVEFVCFMDPENRPLTPTCRKQFGR